MSLRWPQDVVQDVQPGREKPQQVMFHRGLNDPGQRRHHSEWSNEQIISVLYFICRGSSCVLAARVCLCVCVWLFVRLSVSDWCRAANLSAHRKWK